MIDNIISGNTIGVKPNTGGASPFMAFADTSAVLGEDPLPDFVRDDLAYLDATGFDRAAFDRDASGPACTA